MTRIGYYAFEYCNGLKKTGKFKATDCKMCCRDYQYALGKQYIHDGSVSLCKRGFHYCENAFDLFAYYGGKIGKDIRVFEVDADDISDEREKDSKRVCGKIRLVREYKSFAELLNENNTKYDS